MSWATVLWPGNQSLLLFIWLESGSANEIKAWGLGNAFSERYAELKRDDWHANHTQCQWNMLTNFIRLMNCGPLDMCSRWHCTIAVTIEKSVHLKQQSKELASNLWWCAVTDMFILYSNAHTQTNVNDSLLFSLRVNTMSVVSFAWNWTNLTSSSQEKDVCCVLLHFPSGLLFGT